MRVLIIGGGIAGLATALALRRAGLDAIVFERAGKLEEVGAGLALWANALRALERLGVGEAARAHGAAGRRVVLRRADGRYLSDVDLEPPLASLGLHRADLQTVLHEAAGADTVRLGRTCVGYEQDPDGVTARFDGGGNERGDVLVGADGLRSTVRAVMLGAEPPRFAGYLGWRAVVARRELVEDGLLSETWGRGIRFGIVDIGRDRVYWFVSESAAASEEERPPGRKAYLLERLRGWHEPVAELVESTPEEAIFRTAIYDRKPASRWSERRVTLVGDAAHPMTPNLSQGAGQSLEDAVVLADCLARERDPAVAFHSYEERRRNRANALVRRSWQVGWIAQLANPVASRMRDVAVGVVPSWLDRAQLEALNKSTIRS